MKKVLKVLLTISLVVMLMPAGAYANNEVEEDVDVVEVGEGFVPFSPNLPQDWTEEQWRDWGLALELCLVPLLDRAQELVDEATAILVAAGVPVAIVPTTLLVASTEIFAMPAARSIDLTPAQIALLTDLVDQYTDLSTRIENFLYAFENTEMEFELAITYVYNLCEELSVLNTDLEKALDSLGDDTEPCDPPKEGTCPPKEKPTCPSTGGTVPPTCPSTGGTVPPTCPSTGGTLPSTSTPQQPGGSQPGASGRPTLPQTGTTLALAGIGTAGIALTAIGAIAAHIKRKNENS